MSFSFPLTEEDLGPRSVRMVGKKAVEVLFACKDMPIQRVTQFKHVIQPGEGYPTILSAGVLAAIFFNPPLAFAGMVGGAVRSSYS